MHISLLTDLNPKPPLTNVMGFTEHFTTYVGSSMNLKENVRNHCPTILHIDIQTFNLFVAFLCGFKLSWCQCSENIIHTQSENFVTKKKNITVDKQTICMKCLKRA